MTVREWLRETVPVCYEFNSYEREYNWPQCVCADGQWAFITYYESSQVLEGTNWAVGLLEPDDLSWIDLVVEQHGGVVASGRYPSEYYGLGKDEIPNRRWARWPAFFGS